MEVGKAGVDRYVGAMLAFLGRRVLGQYDPQLMATEPMGGEGLYLVETNVVDWQRHANLPEEDLRRWLILHEMTHAWQFAAHPWLRKYMEESMRVLIESVTNKGPAIARYAAFVGVLPARPVLHPNPNEVEIAFDVALADLMAENVFREERWTAPDRGDWSVFFYDLPDDIVWGATARVLTEFLDLVTRRPSG